MIASASLSANDGGLGTAEALKRPVAVVGCCSSGTAATPVECSTIEDVVTTFGYGPLAETAALILDLAGGPVVCVRTTSGTAAVLGTVCQGGAGTASAGTAAAAGGNTSVAAPTLAGTPDAPYAVRLRVSTAGANLAASPAVEISLDGGVTYLAAAVAVAGPTAIGTTGLTIAWADGSFVLGDTWDAAGANCATDADATGTTALTASGTPLDTFDVRVKVTRAGTTIASATAAIKVSLDGGNSYSEEIAVPTSGAYVIPNTGITVTFSGATTLVVGDIYRLKTAAPIWSTGTLGTALDALVASLRDYEFVHICGAVDATSFGTMKTWVDAREAAGEYTASVLEARDQVTGESIATWVTSLTGTTPGFSSVSSDRCLDLFATHCLIKSALRSGVYWRRNGARLLTARLAGIPIKEDPGRVKSGAIVGLMPDGAASSVFHDVRTYTALDSHRLGGIQTIQGRARGEYYFTARTMAPAGSDFLYPQRIRVLNEASHAGLAAISEYVGEDLDVKTDGTGRITVAEAKAIDAAVLAAVKRAVFQAPNVFVSGVSVQTNRTDNIVSTGILRVSIAVVPRGTVKTVSATISFSLTA